MFTARHLAPAVPAALLAADSEQAGPATWRDYPAKTWQA
jgi:hypothetical protein